MPIVMGLFLICFAIGFVRMNHAHWEPLAAVKQLLDYSQNLDITSQISIVWPGVYLSFTEWFKIFARYAIAEPSLLCIHCGGF